jgi:hypothetical protein
MYNSLLVMFRRSCSIKVTELYLVSGQDLEKRSTPDKQYQVVEITALRIHRFGKG